MQVAHASAYSSLHLSLFDLYSFFSDSHSGLLSIVHVIDMCTMDNNHYC